MSSLIKNAHTRVFRRHVSSIISPSISLNVDTSERAFTRDKEERVVKVKERSLSLLQRLESSNSRTFVESLSSSKPITKVESNTPIQVVKKKIFQLIKTQEYETLLQTMIALVNNNSIPITKIFDNYEITSIMRNLIAWQTTLYGRRLTDYATFTQSNIQFESIYKKYREVTDIYDKLVQQFEFELSVRDYENLIGLCVKNYRLDYATNYIRRYELQGLKPTLKIWNYKFKVLGDGLPYTWKFESGHNKHHQLIHYDLVARKDIKILLNEFNESNLSMDLDTLETIILCIGKSKDVEFLEQFIESVWSIRSDGAIDEEHLLSANHINYPSTDILRAIVLSFSFNNEFFKAMNYISYFESIYPKIKLDTVESLKFWKTVLDYCQITHKHENVLLRAEYLNQNSTASVTSEKYIKYDKEIKKNMYDTWANVWNLYRSSNKYLDLRIYRRRIQQLTKHKKITPLIELLPDLEKIYQNSVLNPNDKYLNNYNSYDIYRIYTYLLKGIIIGKIDYGYIDDIKPIVDQWSLDEAMIRELESWYVGKVHKFHIRLEQRRANIDQKQTVIDQEENEGILELW